MDKPGKEACDHMRPNNLRSLQSLQVNPQFITALTSAFTTVSRTFAMKFNNGEQNWVNCLWLII